MLLIFSGKEVLSTAISDQASPRVLFVPKLILVVLYQIQYFLLFKKCHDFIPQPLFKSGVMMNALAIQAENSAGAKWRRKIIERRYK